MTDPIGTSGRTQGGVADFDFGAVVEGGSRFLQRMEALAKAKDEHDQAFSQLGLGRTAAAALAHASQLHEAAATAHTQASRALGDANERSTATINEANATAARIIASAKSEAEAIEARCKQHLAQAMADAERIRAKAQALKAEAQEIMDVAVKAGLEAAVIMKAAHEDKSKVEADRKDVDDRRKRLVIARDKLVVAIKEADGYVFGI